MVYKPSLSLIKTNLTKITKYLYNVKKEVTQKVAHSESISKMFHIVGILTDHMANSQLAKKSQMTGVYMIQKTQRRTRLT